MLFAHRRCAGTRQKRRSSGTAIWPELNVLYVLYGSSQEASLIVEAVGQVKKSFPGRGSRYFSMK